GAVEQGFSLRDIKAGPITPAGLDRLKEKAGSYAALFSRRAIKYKGMGLKEKRLKEPANRRLIPEEYTWLQRPVVMAGKKLFVGSEKNTVGELKRSIGG